MSCSRHVGRGFEVFGVDAGSGSVATHAGRRFVIRFRCFEMVLSSSAMTKMVLPPVPLNEAVVRLS